MGEHLLSETISSKGLIGTSKQVENNVSLVVSLVDQQSARSKKPDKSWWARQD
jgi:hypothetical protein